MYRVELLAYPDAVSVAVHEFRIPPKALLGLHSYCPVHFDAFHSVLVDVSVHISLLKAGSFLKVHRFVTLLHHINQVGHHRFFFDTGYLK